MELSAGSTLVILGAIGVVIYLIYTKAKNLPGLPTSQIWTELQGAAMNQLQSNVPTLYPGQASVGPLQTSSAGTQYVITTNSDGSKTMTVTGSTGNLQSFTSLDPIGPSGQTMQNYLDQGWSYQQIADFITGN